MAELVCAWCGDVRELTRIVRVKEYGDKDDIIRGVLTCRKCQKQTIFGMTNNAISFYPGKEPYGKLSPNTPPKVIKLFQDAELCFYGTGFRGSVAMCRASVEKALEQKNVKPNRLEEMINEAKNSGILTDREYMLAHGSRLAGNDALHKEDTFEPSCVPAVLSATVSVIGHLFP